MAPRAAKRRRPPGAAPAFLHPPAGPPDRPWATAFPARALAPERRRPPGPRALTEGRFIDRGQLPSVPGPKGEDGHKKGPATSCRAQAVEKVACATFSRFPWLPCARGAARDPCGETLAAQGFLRICCTRRQIRLKPAGATGLEPPGGFHRQGPATSCRAFSHAPYGPKGGEVESATGAQTRSLTPAPAGT